MTHFRLLPATVFLVAAAYASGALAALTDSQVTRFIDSLPAVHTISKQMEKDGMKEIVTPQDMMPKPGEIYLPYTAISTKLKERAPQAYSAIEKSVGEHGFSNLGDWASVGDQVLKAYVAVTMTDQMAQQEAFTKAMTPQAMASMPPQARQQLESAQAMMEQMKKVPAEDKAAVKPHVKQLEQAMQQAQ